MENKDHVKELISETAGELAEHLSNDREQTVVMVSIQTVTFVDGVPTLHADSGARAPIAYSRIASPRSAMGTAAKFPPTLTCAAMHAMVLSRTLERCVRADAASALQPIDEPDSVDASKAYNALTKLAHDVAEIYSEAYDESDVFTSVRRAVRDDQK